MNFFDIHSHLNFKVFREDISSVITRMREQHIRSIVVGSQRTTSERAIACAEAYPDLLYAAVALHPVHLFSMNIVEEGMPFVTREETFDIDAYRSLARNDAVVAIGECGLDYHQFPASPSIDACKKMQRDVLCGHIALAKELHKPLMLHCRASAPLYTDAYNDLADILSDANWPPAVVHAFASHVASAKKCIEGGAMISFTGLITYPEYRSLEDVVRFVPLDRIMIETDSPYMSPDPNRHQRNEPTQVAVIARRIGEIKKIPVQVVAEVTTANAENFFKIKRTPHA